MKAIERLEKLLDERDERIEELECKLSEAEEVERTWMTHVNFDKGEEPHKKLPVPRLHLEWIDPGDGTDIEAAYSLVYRHLLGHIVYIPLGLTRSSGALANRVNPNGSVDLPFRDGAHLRNEMEQLGLRAFGVCGKTVHEYKICFRCGRLDEVHRGEGFGRDCNGERPLEGYPRPEARS